MSRLPELTRTDRHRRRERVLRDYASGHCSRSCAALHGLSDGHVRQIVRDAGIARGVGKRKPARNLPDAPGKAGTRDNVPGHGMAT